MTKMTMMAFMQQMKGVDSRVTDVVKESTLMSAQLQELSTKEESDHDKVKDLTYTVQADHKKIQQNEGKIEMLTMNKQSDHLKVRQNEEKIQNLTENVQDNQMKVGQNEEKIQNLTKNVDQNEEKIKTLDQSFETLREELRELKEKHMVDKLHPVGSIYLTFTNNKPPLNGQFGVRWELLPEGYTLMSANDWNVGDQGGNTRLDSGRTEAHVLTEDEMPSHSHTFRSFKYDRRDGLRLPFFNGAIPYNRFTEKALHRQGVMNHTVMV